MNKAKLPIIIVLVLVAGVAGLFVSGVLGGEEKDAGKKHPVTPVSLVTEDATGFTINLADGDKTSFVVMNVALEPAPMTDAELELWNGASGGHGGATEPPGPAAMASYPKFRDAVIATASTFTSDELLAKGGKDKLKDALLAKFDEIAQRDEAAYGTTKDGATHDPSHPPYHIQDVYLQKFGVQVKGS